MSALLSSRRARVASLCLWAASVVVLAIGALHKAHRPRGYDLTVYLDAAEALVRGQSPYVVGAPYPYIYPLFLAAVLTPLTVLPRDGATLVWLLASVGSLVAAARVTIALARERGILGAGIPLTVPLVALWFLLFDPIQSDLLNGQVNFEILLLCLLGLRASVGGRAWGSAWPVAAAVAVKLNPVVLLGFLGARRRWAAMALCVGVTALFVLAPLLALGSAGWRAYGTYLFSLLLPRLRGDVAAHRGVRFSVNGVLQTVAPGWGQAAWQRVAGASAPLLGLAVVEILSRRRPRNREIWIFCLYLVALPLMTPLSEVHHLAYAFPALALLGLGSLPGVGLLHARSGPGVAVALLLLAGGRLSRSGPYFFLALCLIGALVTAEALAAPAGRPSDARASLSPRP